MVPDTVPWHLLPFYLLRGLRNLNLLCFILLMVLHTGRIRKDCQRPSSPSGKLKPTKQTKKNPSAIYNTVCCIKYLYKWHLFCNWLFFPNMMFINLSSFIPIYTDVHYFSIWINQSVCVATLLMLGRQADSEKVCILVGGFL